MKSANFKEAIEQICASVVPDCLALVERDETLIYSIAELITVFISDSTASAHVEKSLIDKLIADLDTELEGLLRSEETESNRFRYLLHLFCLLW